jgi:hypothetical protein
MAGKLIPMLRVCSIILFVITLLSCSTRPKVPRDLPGEKEMAEILADIYQLESVLGQTRLSYNSGNKDNVSGYYRNVLDQYEMTKVEFDTAMAWYSANPTVLSDVYAEVIEILSRRDAELKNAMNKEKEQKLNMAKVPSKIDLWNDTTAFKVPFAKADSLDNRVAFDIDVDSLSGGIIRLYAEYSFVKEGLLDSAQMKMITCYADSSMDTLSYQIHKSFKPVKGNVSHQISDSKNLVKVKGLLFDHDTTKNAPVTIDDIKLTFIKNLGAEVMEQR